MLLKMFFILFYSLFLQMISCMSLNTAWKKRDHVLPIYVLNHVVSEESLDTYFWMTEKWTSEINGI